MQSNLALLSGLQFAIEKLANKIKENYLLQKNTANIK
jgi:hypothetical protein